jgi:hypothetical protein
VCSVYRAFREALVFELLKDPLPKARKQVYLTKNTTLPSIRLTRPIGIHQPILRKASSCVFCVTGRGLPSHALNSRIANKVFNLILVLFGRLAEWLKLLPPLA